MGYVFLCFNGGNWFTYLNHSEQLPLFSTKWSKLELYTLSTDEIFVVKNLHASKGLFVDIDCLKIGHYVAAVYEDQWYPSLILEINWDQRDMLVKSMHNSSCDKNCFFQPPRDDMCHSPTLLDLLKCQMLSIDMDKTVAKSVQNCLN